MKTNVKSLRLALGLSALALTSSFLPAPASASAVTGSEKTFDGTVTAVDLDQHTVQARGTLFLSKKFNLGAACSYAFLDNANGTQTSLHPGQKIKVSYQNADGVLVADRIEQQAMRFTGYVKTVDPSTRTLTVQPGGFGMGKQFRFADGCKVTLRGNRVGTFADIQPGNYVSLLFETPPGVATVQSVSQTSESFTGSLTAIDLEQKTLKAKTVLESKSFNVGDHCVVVINGKNNGRLSDLKPEDKLVFTFDEISGVNVVNRIAPAKDTTEAVSSTAPPGGF